MKRLVLCLGSMTAVLVACSLVDLSDFSGDALGQNTADASSEADTGASQPDATADAVADATAEGGGAVATIRCGAAECPASDASVCCVLGSASTCTATAACTGAPLACDDTADCVQLGFGPTFVCCGFQNPTAVLARSVCVAVADCDPNGSQDQLCSATGPTEECKIAGDGRTLCAPYTYANQIVYSICMFP